MADIRSARRPGAGGATAGSGAETSSKSSFTLVYPIASQVKGYPFEVAVPAGHSATGVILADHVKSVDWKARCAEKTGRCSSAAIEEVRSRLAPLLGY